MECFQDFVPKFCVIDNSQEVTLLVIVQHLDIKVLLMKGDILAVSKEVIETVEIVKKVSQEIFFIKVETVILEFQVHIESLFLVVEIDIVQILVLVKIDMEEVIGGV